MSIKRNFLFSTVLTVSNYIFPFIVYPYVARVLGVNNIGICNFVDSIVNYAMMISLMGLSIIGVRDIAKSKSDPHRLDVTFTSLMMLCMAFTVLASVMLTVCTFCISSLHDYRPLLLIGLLKLWSNFFLIEWFYRGMEDFKYITLRTIIIRTCFVIAVFVLVRTASDYVLYYLLMALTITANAAVNCLRAFRHVRLRVSFADIKAKLKPFVILGVYLFLNSMYTTLNVIFLGFLCGDVQVGYYTTATKIFSIVLAIYTAFSGVVMPRASALLSEGKHEEFMALIRKSVDALTLFAIPAVFFMMIYSHGVVDLIAGFGYEGAVLPMIVTMPLIFIIGYEQILVVQILTPMANDRVILFNSIVGASVGLLLNMALVYSFQSVGSSVVWFMSEVAVLISAQHFVTKFTGFKFPYRKLLVNVLAYIPFAVLSVFAVLFISASPIILMCGGMAFVAFYAFVVQRYILKNPIFCDLYFKLIRKSRNHYSV